MADKLAGGIKAGATSVTTSFVLLSAADGSEISGKVAADLTFAYVRQGGTVANAALNDLAAVNSAWTSLGVKEYSSSVMKGSYRLDPPNTAFATGADWVEINVSCAGSQVYKERFALETVGAAEVFTLATTINGFVSVLPSAAAITTAVWAAGTRTLTSFGTLVADIWANASRTLSSFGFSVGLAQSVWAETPSTGAGTAGQLLTAAGGAADPLLNAVPGTYTAGTAGFVIGNIGSDSATIGAINAKTAQLTFSTPNVVDASATGGLSAASIAAAVLNTAMTEGYAADGAQMTLTQALYMVHQFLTERSLSGTAMTIKKLDGASTAAVVTTNSATNPTSYTRIA